MIKQHDNVIIKQFAETLINFLNKNEMIIRLTTSYVFIPFKNVLVNVKYSSLY